MRALVSASMLPTDSGTYPTDDQLRTYFYKRGLRARGTPEKRSDEKPDAFDERLRTFHSSRAEKILARVPEHTDEQREKKNLEREALVFTAYLTSSDTELMVTRRADGAVLFRLLNSRLGKLFDGCRELVLLLSGMSHYREISKRLNSVEARQEIEASGTHVRFILEPEIEVYEHGLEEPTISGRIIRHRWRYVRQNESRDVIVAAFTVLVFAALVVLNTYINAQSPLHEAFERIETAMITTGMVALLSLLHAYWRLVPVVQWSLDPKVTKKGASTRGAP